MKVITTLPSPDRRGSTELIEAMFMDPIVIGARWNGAIRSSLPAKETLEWANTIAERYGKKIWIDLKGRQLRIAKWAFPTYADVHLNRSITASLPARISFRGAENDISVIRIDGDRIWLDNAPRHALGAGQAVNVIADDLVVHGDYLSGNDLELIEAGTALGMTSFMLSFVENHEDIRETEEAIIALSQTHIEPELYLKIESKKGLRFATEGLPNQTLILARDDMMDNIGSEAGIIRAALDLITVCPSSIAASQIFLGLENGGRITAADMSDIKLLDEIGYRVIMLSDGISHHHFSEAITAVRGYNRIFRKEDDR